MSFGRYTLNDDGQPVPCDDLLEWGRWLQDEEHRIVARDFVDDVKISTVFLGIDHNWGPGPPLLFETMVFGGKLDGEQERYATKAEAIKGHVDMVARVYSSSRSRTG